ncbi:hypothetical protein T440DRAFT_475448 [Plenodomus tracheiphilus IPT5]|uniref:Uncharacterized protein n=1 Tax=Plenodomus tracheiphilus IPT5 TaxID=1408161 RepID=A0A6A7BL19_9PLEO|nr:hypothetical protein T440DRAFT_475448 [Plenodomus tracheiphilus IPT5]
MRHSRPGRTRAYSLARTRTRLPRCQRLPQAATGPPAFALHTRHITAVAVPRHGGAPPSDPLGLGACTRCALDEPKRRARGRSALALRTEGGEGEGEGVPRWPLVALDGSPVPGLATTIAKTHTCLATAPVCLQPGNARRTRRQGLGGREETHPACAQMHAGRTRHDTYCTVYVHSTQYTVCSGGVRLSLLAPSAPRSDMLDGRRPPQRGPWAARPAADSSGRLATAAMARSSHAAPACWPQGPDNQSCLSRSPPNRGHRITVDPSSESSTRLQHDQRPRDRRRTVGHVWEAAKPISATALPKQRWIGGWLHAHACVHDSTGRNLPLAFIALAQYRASPRGAISSSRPTYAWRTRKHPHRQYNCQTLYIMMPTCTQSSA